MLRSPVLLCLGLIALAPGLAQASEDAPLASASPDEIPLTPSPPLVPAPEEAEGPSSHEEPSSRGEFSPDSAEGQSSGLPAPARISLEVMGGAAGGALSYLLVYYAGRALLGDCYEDLGCTFIQLGTTTGATLLGTPLGVSVVGSLAGGQGSYWPSLLGMAVGSAAGVALVAVFQKDENETLQYISIVTLPVAGAVLGYELWHAHRQPDSAEPERVDVAGSSPRLIPLLGVTPNGGVFGGLAARF